MGISIAIRSIQHYLYCPHRWGLLEIDRAWAENAFVTKANLMHSRVHDPDQHYTQRGKKVFTSVRVYCDEENYDLYGVTDCIEATEDAGGIALPGSDGRFRLCIVEYKPTKPKGKDYNEEDLMQVYAQKKCVDFVFGCDCEGVLYYADVKKRVALPLRENASLYDERLRQILSAMRQDLQCGRIPPIEKKQKCSGCSMKDLCMPSARKGKRFRAALAQLQENGV